MDARVIEEHLEFPERPDRSPSNFAMSRRDIGIDSSDVDVLTKAGLRSNVIRRKAVILGETFWNRRRGVDGSPIITKHVSDVLICKIDCIVLPSSFVAGGFSVTASIRMSSSHQCHSFCIIETHATKN